MTAWLTFLRAPNLLIVALTQYFLRHAVLRPALQRARPPVPFDLTELQFALLVLATVCVAAGGYVVNDLYDQAIDRINKPDRVFVGRRITHRQAWMLYGMLTLAGFALAAFVGWEADYLEWLFLYPLSVGALWWYSYRLKRTVLWGNVVVSLFTAGVVLLVWLAEQRAFEALAALHPSVARLTALTMIFYAAFAFAGNLLREIIKDLEDVAGDVQHGARTLPIVHGARLAKGAALVLLALLMVLAFGFLMAVAEEMGALTLAWGVLLIFVPLLALLPLLLRAEEVHDFHRLSIAVKGVMLTGLLYLPIVGMVA